MKLNNARLKGALKKKIGLRCWLPCYICSSTTLIVKPWTNCPVHIKKDRCCPLPIIASSMNPYHCLLWTAPFPTQIVRHAPSDPVGDRHDRHHRIDAARAGKHARVGDVQLLGTPNLSS